MIKKYQATDVGSQTTDRNLHPIEFYKSAGIDSKNHFLPISKIIE